MTIETPRLILRPWRPQDLEPYAAMMADPRVGDWLGGVQAREGAQAALDRMEAQRARLGYAGWAVERRADGALIGAVGLSPLDETHGPGLEPGVIEIGWRLAPDAWGAGYATEAAEASLDDGFGRLGLKEIVAFTARTNARSQAVMRRLGMARRPDLDFDHPRLALDHPLRAHVVFVAGPRRA